MATLKELEQALREGRSVRHRDFVAGDECASLSACGVLCWSGDHMAPVELTTDRLFADDWELVSEPDPADEAWENAVKEHQIWVPNPYSVNFQNHFDSQCKNWFRRGFEAGKASK